MALCESQLESALGAVSQVKRDDSPSSDDRPNDSPDKKQILQSNGDVYPLDQVPDSVPLSVDYRSPVSHFIPPAVELYAARQKNESVSTPESSSSPSPMKRKRGRPRVDKTSPEYLAKSAARKQAREISKVIVASSSSAMLNSHSPQPGEKRKRGRPRVDKTSPEYLARKRAREIEALERKTKKEYRRTGDSVASSSSETPRVKRKYTKRAPGAKKDNNQTAERVKGKRGRPRKTDATPKQQIHQPKIRVRSNLMPDNSEPITLDSDDEPNLGSPSQASDSLSWDENLRALRHIHEKYANIDKDDLYEAHLLAANFKKPGHDQRSVDRNRDEDEVLSIRSSEGRSSVKELDTRVEKLEDSSNSDSDSSSSGSGSSSSDSSSSSSSDDSSSSDSSDSESDNQSEKPNNVDNNKSFAWGATANASAVAGDSDASGTSSPDPERACTEPPPPPADDVSESENESADKSFQCHICRKWYSTRVTLKIHRRVHQNKGGGNSRSRTRSTDRYECDCCNETFNRREKLWEHKASAHRGAMTVRCEVCRKCFEDDAELAAHDRTHTYDERAGRCSDCGAVFQRWEQLRRHRTAVHNATPPAHSAGNNARLPHACNQCGKRFGHAHSLTRHMHNHAKQLYRCVVCKASFVRAEQLAQHLNSHLANYKRLKP